MDTFNKRQAEITTQLFKSASAGSGHEKPTDNSSVSHDVSASEIPAQNNKQGAVLPATTDHLDRNSDHQSLHKSPSQSQSSPKKKTENYPPPQTENSPIPDLISFTPSASKKKLTRSSSSSSESSDESVSGNPTPKKDSQTKSDRNNNEGENHQSLHKSPSQSQSSPKKKTEDYPPPQTENSQLPDLISFSPSASVKKPVPPRSSSSSSDSSDESVSGNPTPNKDSHTKSDQNNHEGENPAPILPLVVAKPDKSAPSLEKSDSKKQNHGNEEANRADNGQMVGLATTGELGQRTKSISRSNSESRNTLPEKHHAEIKVPNDTHGQIKVDHDNSQSSRSSSSGLTDGSNDDHVKQKEPESENQSSPNPDEQKTIIPAIFDAAPKSQDKKSDHSESDISHKEQHVQQEIHIVPDKQGSKLNSNASDISHTHKHDSSSHSSKSSKLHEDQITPKEVADQNEVIYNVSEHFVQKDSSAQHEHDSLHFGGPLHIRPEKPTSKDLSSAQNQGHDGSHSASDTHLVQNKEHDGSRSASDLHLVQNKPHDGGHSGSDVHLVEIKGDDGSHSASSHSDHSSSDKEKNKETEHVKEAGSSEHKNNLLLDLFPGLTNTHHEQPTSNDSNKGLHKEQNGNRSLSGHSGSSSDKSESKKLIENNTEKDSSKKKEDHEVLHFPEPVKIIPEQPVPKDPNTHAKKEHDENSSSSGYFILHKTSQIFKIVGHSAHRSDNNKGKQSAEENETKKDSSPQKDDHNILPSFSLPILLSGKHDSHDSSANKKKEHNESHSASDHSANSNGNKARDLKLHKIKTPKDSSQQKDSGDSFKKDLEHRQEHDDIHGVSLDTELQKPYIAVPVPKKKKKRDRAQDDGDAKIKGTEDEKAKKDEEKDNSSSAPSLSSSSSISSDSSSDEDGSGKNRNQPVLENESKSASEKPTKGEVISPGKKKPKKLEFPVPYDESASEKSHRIVTSPKTPEKHEEVKVRGLDSKSVDDYSDIVVRSPKQSSKRENKTNDSDSDSHKPIEIAGDLGKPKSKKKGIPRSDSESDQSGRSKDKKSKKKKQSGNNSESNDSAKSKDKKSKKNNNNSDGGSGSTESFKSTGKPTSPRSPKKAEKKKHNSSSNSGSDESEKSQKHKKKESGSDESSQNTDDKNKHDDGQLQTPQGWAGWIAAAPSNLLWGAWARMPSREAAWNMVPSRQAIASRLGYGAAQPAPQQQPVKA
ncbi:dentin sialophosphoprotein-like [Planococcus citri]|uniref:dentin sialophosphoprotein-like n=1 Tax=Planococcus citri TaxID=170843 RepID=UPI0031F72B63